MTEEKKPDERTPAEALAEAFKLKPETKEKPVSD